MTLHFSKKEGGTSLVKGGGGGGVPVVPPAVKEEIWHPHPNGKIKQRKFHHHKQCYSSVAARGSAAWVMVLLLGSLLILAMVSFLLFFSSKPGVVDETVPLLQKNKYKSKKNMDHYGDHNNDNQNDTELSCQGMLQVVADQNIQLVAIDFDKTILDVHTGGRWQHPASKLVPHVRPQFKCFMSELLHSQIPVAVATFSTQIDLIETVLKRALKSSIKDNDWNNIPIFGGDAYVKGHSKGKQSQLVLAMEHFNNGHAPAAQRIIPQSTLLVDDDRDNIHVAETDGYNTILYRPHKKGSLSRELELSEISIKEPRV